MTTVCAPFATCAPVSCSADALSADACSWCTGETDTCDEDDVFLLPSVGFGEEKHALQVLLLAYPLSNLRLFEIWQRL